MTQNLKNQEIETAKKELLKMLSASGVKKNTIYCGLRHVSSSGMMRHINFYIAGKDGIKNINWWIERILDYKRDKSSNAIKVGGCGMDMGFHVVYSLSSALFPKGFKVTGYGRNGDTSGWDNDGGYKLKQEWI